MKGHSRSSHIWIANEGFDVASVEESRVDGFCEIGSCQNKYVYILL